MLLNPNRRGLILGGLATLIAAPAGVRAEWLMPIKGEPMREYRYGYWFRGPPSMLSPYPGEAWGGRMVGLWEHKAGSEWLTKSQLETFIPSFKESGEYVMSSPAGELIDVSIHNGILRDHSRFRTLDA